MQAQILPFETKLERLLKKACRQLSLEADYGLCDYDTYFRVIGELDKRIVERKRR